MLALGVIGLKISNTIIDRMIKNKFYIYKLIPNIRYMIKWNYKFRNYALNTIKSYTSDQIKAAIQQIRSELRSKCSKKCSNCKGQKSLTNLYLCNNCINIRTDIDGALADFDGHIQSDLSQFF
eukprot:265657_1